MGNEEGTASGAPIGPEGSGMAAAHVQVPPQNGEGRAGAGPAGRTERRARRLLARGFRFAKEHPTGTLVAVAGVAAFAELELAAAALLGIGATALVTKKSGREMRDEVSNWGKAGRTRVAGLFERLEKAVAPEHEGPPPAQPGAPAPPPP